MDFPAKLKALSVNVGHSTLIFSYSTLNVFHSAPNHFHSRLNQKDLALRLQLSAVSPCDLSLNLTSSDLNAQHSLITLSALQAMVQLATGVSATVAFGVLLFIARNRVPNCSAMPFKPGVFLATVFT